MEDMLFRSDDTMMNMAGAEVGYTQSSRRVLGILMFGQLRAEDKGTIPPRTRLRLV